MRRIRTYHEVPDPAGDDVLRQVLAQRERLAGRLRPIRRVIAIASGKGGVGKSVVTANLAAALAARGNRVGAADADLNGPSLARMLGATGPLRVAADGVHPAPGSGGVRVMSMDLLLASDDAPVRWREPEEGAFVWQSTLETGALREFLADTVWGELDYLLIDVPPGTDKLSRLLQLLPSLGGVLLVTTPSEAARFVVAKSARLARDASAPLLGLVANMTSYRCDACGVEKPLFEGEGAKRLAESAELELLAEIPFDPSLAVDTDAGRPFVLERPDSPAAQAIARLAERVEAGISPPLDDLPTVPVPANGEAP